MLWISYAMVATGKNDPSIWNWNPTWNFRLSSSGSSWQHGGQIVRLRQSDRYLQQCCVAQSPRRGEFNEPYSTRKVATYRLLPQSLFPSTRSAVWGFASTTNWHESDGAVVGWMHDWLVGWLAWHRHCSWNLLVSPANRRGQRSELINTCRISTTKVFRVSWQCYQMTHA